MGTSALAPITTRADLIAFAARLDGVAEIGFDTEFHAEHTYWPKVMLLQFSTPDELVLIDPLATEVKASLGGFLELIKMRQQTIIGHALGHDLGIFFRLNGGLPIKVFDTQIAAAFLGYERPVSLGGLLQDCLGVCVDKLYSRADWGKRPLPPAQLEYAADDVRHLFPLVESLRTELTKLGRLTWVDEECQRALDPTIYHPSEPAEAWRRVSRKPAPGSRAHTVLVAIAAERERIGLETDRAPRKLLPDEVVVDLARRAPTTLADLDADTRRRPAPNLKKYGDRWLEAIHVGLESPIIASSELELMSPDTQAACDLGKVVLHWALRRANIAPWLFEDMDQRIHEMALNRPADMQQMQERLGISGWRSSVVLSPLWEVLGNGSSLRIETVGLGLQVAWPFG
ncbi:MAG: HRDC domain-containing protein [Myxococcales bacterium]|nr:HRDC domain-containing protein [Myxococcales bacterium]